MIEVYKELLANEDQSMSCGSYYVKCVCGFSWQETITDLLNKLSLSTEVPTLVDYISILRDESTDFILWLICFLFLSSPFSSEIRILTFIVIPSQCRNQTDFFYNYHSLVYFSVYWKYVIYRENRNNFSLIRSHRVTFLFIHQTRH